MCFGWISLQEPLPQESSSPLQEPLSPAGAPQAPPSKVSLPPQEPPMAHMLATAASAVALAFLTWA